MGSGSEETKRLAVELDKLARQRMRQAVEEVRAAAERLRTLADDDERRALVREVKAAYYARHGDSASYELGDGETVHLFLDGDLNDDELTDLQPFALGLKITCEDAVVEAFVPGEDEIHLLFVELERALDEAESAREQG